MIWQKKIIQGVEVALPFTLPDQDVFREFRPNQTFTTGVPKGHKKERSVKQLGAYWLLCDMGSKNTEDVNWNTRDKMDLQCRYHTGFFDPKKTIVFNNQAINYPMSISFKNLGHISACNYFDRSFDVLQQFFDMPIAEILRQGRKAA